MVAIAMLLLWGGYSTGLWGWCLIRDYNITFGQLTDPLHPYTGPWPPAKIPATQVWPGKSATATAGGGVSETQTGGGQIGVGPNTITVPFGGFPLTLSDTSGTGAQAT
jgi:hypothetical protein